MTGSAPSPKRRYDNTLRRERANETRDRIVAAGTELVHGAPIRDWRGVTIRAVAERAGVNERTVYRHFANERALRDAVMQRLEQESGIDLGALELGGIGEAAARIFSFVSSYPVDARPALDPTLVEANRRQHDALLGAVKRHAQQWPAVDQTVAAAALDLLWAVASYERLVHDWQLEPADATRGLTWVIDLVETAVRDGRRPPPRPRRKASRTST